MGLHTLFAPLGLVPRSELERARAKKEVWHGLVRDVFARYYLKLREPFPELLPDLPRRYSRAWESEMKSQLKSFVELDLRPVGELLDTCGFGTPRWQPFVQEVLPQLGQLIAGAATAPAAAAGEASTQRQLEEARGEIRKLRAAGRRALEQLRERERQLEDLRAAGADAPAAAAAEGDERIGALERENRQLRARLASREQTIAALNNQLEDLESDMALRPPPAPEAAGDGDDELRASDPSAELARLNQQLQRDLRAKEHAIEVLRGRVGELEEEMGTARDQLRAEVEKISALTAGEIEIKPSEELEEMDADGLLSYAREVATDLDVRRQTLDEGLKGIDALKDNYEGSRALYEKQQRRLEEELEKVVVELRQYEERAQREEGEKGGESLLAAQREQLRLLSSRIRELQAANRDLGESNQKMYRDLDMAVKRIIPLRRQIEELESLRDALSSYIRRQYDRTFTIRKLTAPD